MDNNYDNQNNNQNNQNNNQNNNYNKSGKSAVPEARAALDAFKYEVANEIGVPLQKGYNGHLTAAQSGSIGGQMVKKMIANQEQQMANKTGQ
ncbi:MAG: alpha/beta-type small acid-soluble spore protein [Defluviitaleaceae bacterium]|nr:alpha/beta-type small acid-soluble spore protein [Defluviitaleaceae bacterium]